MISADEVFRAGDLTSCMISYKTFLNFFFFLYNSYLMVSLSAYFQIMDSILIQSMSKYVYVIRNNTLHFGSIFFLSNSTCFININLASQHSF